jgi:O-antigen/teichoic acid export membrane protein
MLYTLGNFLPRLGAFLLLPVYTATLTPADFGVFSLMLSLSGLLAILYRLGLDGALMRFHFDVDQRRRPALYATLSLATLVAGIVISLVLGAIGAPLFERLFAGVAFWPIGALTLLLTFLTAFQYVPASLLRATEQPGRFVAFTAGVFVMGVAGTLVFLFGLRLGAAGALLGQVIGAVGILAVTGLVLLRLRPTGLDLGLLRGSLAFGLPLVPHSLSAWVLNLSDRFLISLLIGLSAVEAQRAIGIYSFGYQLGQVVSLVALSFNAAWVPYFYANGEKAEGPAVLREMTTLATGALAVLAVGMAAIAPEVTTILASQRWGAAAGQAAEIVPLVATASLAYGVYFMVVSAVFLVRRTRLLPILTLVAGIANVAANLLLIPRIGILGAAMATLVGYTVLTVATTLYARRGYPLQLDGRRLTLLFAGAIGAMVAARLLILSEAGVALSGIVHLAIALAFALGAFAVIRGPVARLRRLMRRSPDSSGGGGDGTMAPAKENP